MRNSIGTRSFVDREVVVLKYIHVAIAVLIVVPTFILSMFVGIFPAAVMRLFGAGKTADRWMRFNGTNISRTILWSLHMKIEIKGIDRIPRDGTPVCFVSNHQSMLDIPAVIAGLKIWAGFITKQELDRIPLVNSWIRSINCVYIDRNSPRSSISAILKGVENIRKGIPMFIFPEGTRSKTGALGKFKTGSLKLATRAKAVIVPITIDGTRRALEQKQGIGRVRVVISVAEPIPTAQLDEEQLKILPDTVYGAIEEQFSSIVERAV
jgi:1-acyl-sn-glycerol-3-phosphate acyltransferase